MTLLSCTLRARDKIIKVHFQARSIGRDRLSERSGGLRAKVLGASVRQGEVPNSQPDHPEAGPSILEQAAVHHPATAATRL